MPGCSTTQPDGDALGDLCEDAGSAWSGSATRCRTPPSSSLPELSSASRSTRSASSAPASNHQAFITRFEARRPGPLPTPRRGDRAGPGAGAAGPAWRCMPPPPRLLPNRVQRALGRVPAVVPSRRRGDRALPAVGRRPLRSEEGVVEFERTREALRAGEPLELEPSNEYAPEIIHSIEIGEPRVVYGNVRNTSLIDNLPVDACVEVPCEVDGDGVRGAGQRAAAAAGGAEPHLPERRGADGARRPGWAPRARSTRRDAGPQCRGSLSPDAIWGLCDELTAAHDALPAALRAPARVAGSGR